MLVKRVLESFQNDPVCFRLQEVLLYPFSAALSSLRPEERAEVNQTGVSDAFQRYANQEMRRLFAEHLRSLPQEPISSSFDPFGLSSRVMSAGETAQGSGVAGGTSQVYHIGTPSGSENTGSSLFQSIPSQRSSIPSHPTSSPISFGPSTPVMSASAAPAGLLSSPGGMSDVGGTLTPPGLPLSDPPRVSGSYGIPSMDPIFGMSSGSLLCENSGRVPVPAQAPVVPPPPPPGVGDPFAQILVGQSAMSQLMLQMHKRCNDELWEMLECLSLVKWDKGTIQEHRVVIPRRKCAWMRSGFLLCQ